MKTKNQSLVFSVAIQLSKNSEKKPPDMYYTYLADGQDTEPLTPCQGDFHKNRKKITTRHPTARHRLPRPSPEAP